MANETVTQTGYSAPWSAQQPYLTTGFDQALKALKTGGPKIWDQRGYTPFSAQTNQALGMMENLATQGSPVDLANQQLAEQTLRGDFLTPDSNPYLQAYYDRAAESIQPNIASMFGAGGRTGSGAQAMALGRGLADAATGIFGGAYGDERTRQMQMSQLAPAISAQRYADAQRLMGVGSAIEGQSNLALQDRMRRFYAKQNRPEAALNQYLARITGNYGGAQAQTTTSPLYQPSGGQRFLGGAMMGASMFPNNPWTGALMGGAGGYLLGA
tara:strand:- start:6259 stop:7068 length:810 start_codon:yes stop_codon:yes gene_type:complete